jgi:hypothetical protein
MTKERRSVTVKAYERLVVLSVTTCLPEPELALPTIPSHHQAKANLDLLRESVE